MMIVIKMKKRLRADGMHGLVIIHEFGKFTYTCTSKVKYVF
jgi:hypothetical protein